ncbi:MAG: malectin [Sedimentisphaerales bacterium]|nr:malectin [Sedimentisphaerales bacterium]
MSKRLVLAVCVAGGAMMLPAGCASSGSAKTAKVAIRVNCAATEPYTDKADNVWLADKILGQEDKWGAIGGMTIDRGDLGIAGVDAPKVYETERYSMEGYKFIVPNGKYTVRLHFAETYEGITGEGQRIFSVAIDGKTVLENLDVYKEAGGSQKPVVKTIKDVAVTNGELLVGFSTNVQNSEINGIEVFSD